LAIKKSARQVALATAKAEERKRNEKLAAEEKAKMENKQLVSRKRKDCDVDTQSDCVDNGRSGGPDNGPGGGRDSDHGRDNGRGGGNDWGDHNDYDDASDTDAGGNETISRIASSSSMKKAGEGPAKVLDIEDPRVNAMPTQVKTLKTLVEDLVHSKHDVKVNILSASCQCPPMQYVLLSRQRQDIYVKSSPKSPRGRGEGQEKTISPDTAKIMAVVEGAL
jgi:hypothetical protein